MDLLADVLHQAGLRRRLLHARALPAGVALRFPCERSLAFHVALAGPLWLHASGLREPLRLDSGDIVLMARGCEHRIARQPSLAGLPEVAMSVSGPTPVPGADSTAAPTLVSGAYQLWNRPVHPFFAALPDWHLLRADALPQQGPVSRALSLLTPEIAAAEAGAGLALHAVTDLLFVYLMRDLLDRHAPATGLPLAPRDDAVRRAVALLHGDCARAWTLETLAHAVGLSRTLLAERFRQTIGDTPLNYLRSLRLQQAMRLLVDTDAPLERVAMQVGYQDAFSFSKAFKRLVGSAPGEFRRRDAGEREHPWRFAPGERLPSPQTAAPPPR
ncbi:AraC family transcriptional regulator [Nevskia sp.]|uniref:helix-turn-helix transcriptional regulator n=1 Tax=Nevskia sp. TaxID=1929292 RepID=UPI003F707CBD